MKKKSPDMSVKDSREKEDALQLPFQEKIFKTIISENLLHCLDDTSIFLKKLKKIISEDVKVTVENGALTIRGERKQEKEEKNKRFHRVERFYGSFTRSFPLPENVDETKINASFKDGMLNLQIPKTAESKPKVIDVTVK